MIQVDEEALNRLRNALIDAGDKYKNNLSRLSNLMNEITSGDIQGDPATDLLEKYRAKKSTFEGLARTIDEASEYMGIQTAKFGDMIGDLAGGMH